MYVRAPRETHGAPHNRSILTTPFLKSSSPGISGSRDQKRSDLPLESGAVTRFNFRNPNLFSCGGNVAGGQEKGRKSRTHRPKTCVLRQQGEDEGRRREEKEQRSKCSFMYNRDGNTEGAN